MTRGPGNQLACEARRALEEIGRRMTQHASAAESRSLTHRIAYLLEICQARPDQILGVTLGVHAGGKLRFGLTDLLGQERASEVTAAAFHSLCSRLSRGDAHAFGPIERYTIYDHEPSYRGGRSNS